jgi:endoglucanase
MKFISTIEKIRSSKRTSQPMITPFYVINLIANISKIMLSILLLIAVKTVAQTPAGAEVMLETFATTFSGWTIINPNTSSNKVTLENGVLRVYNSDKKDVYISKKYNIQHLQGRTLALSADVVAQGISDLVNNDAHNGIKVMFVLRNANNKAIAYPQIDLKRGTYSVARFGTLINITDETVEGELIIGIQGATGTALIDNLKIIVKDNPIPASRTGDIPKYHTEPMLRGVMVAPYIKIEDINHLKTWQANVVRWQIVNISNPDYSLNKSLLTARIDSLKNLLPIFARNGLKVIVDLHDEQLKWNALQSKVGQATLVAAWQQLATALNNNTGVWAYDLMNEVVEKSWQDDLLLWEDLAEKIALTIRNTGDSTPVIVTAVQGEPRFFRFLRPLNESIKNIIYTSHFYEPLAYTHQGVPGYTAEYTYPGVIAGQNFNKDTLRTALKPIKDFQDKYKVPILIGEFSVARWAKGGKQYLQDCIDLFEEYNWDWLYHAYREAEVWSLEYSDIKTQTQPTSTERKTLVLSYFAKNTVPPPCLSPTTSISNVTNSSTQISWGAITNNQGYELRYRAKNTTIWKTLTLTVVTANLTSLTDNTDYEFEIRTKCNATIYSEWRGGQFKTALVLSVKSVNDEPCSAIVLKPTTVPCTYLPFNNLNATYSVKVPSPQANTCTMSSMSGDVWFKLIMPATKVATVHITAGTLQSFGFAFYQETSSCNSLVLRGTVPCQDKTISWQFFGNSGVVYYIRLWGVGNRQGTFNICTANTIATAAMREANTQVSTDVVSTSALPETLEKILITYPNPVAKTDLTVEYLEKDNSTSNGTIELIDATGKIMLQQTELVQPGLNQYIIKLSKIGSGNYLLRFRIEGKQSTSTQHIQIVK